ncbi:MAG: hypothetical protein ACI30I_04205 [Parabacteroides sp.]
MSRDMDFGYDDGVDEATYCEDDDDPQDGYDPYELTDEVMMELREEREFTLQTRYW